MRFAQTQVWPILRNFEAIAPSTAASTSASSNTMNGALPPSSSPTFFTVPAAWRMRSLPTSVEPVKPTKRTAGCSHIALPIAGASPVKRLRTPAGTPARSASSPRARAVSGVSGAGLATAVQPTASAGASLRVIIAAGKFHGVIAATTPIRLLQDEDPRVGAEGRVDLAVDAVGLLGEEFDETRGVVDFAQRLGEGLPLLARHDECDVLAIGDDQIEPAAQDFGALFGKRFGPGPERPLGRLDRAHGLGMAEARDLGDQRPGRGIMDRVDPLADPGAVDEALAFEQGGIGEFHGASLRRGDRL